MVNESGEWLAFHLTPGNVDDRQPVKAMVKGLSGKLFGDKGYRSKALFEALFAEGLQPTFRTPLSALEITAQRVYPRRI